MSVILWSEPGGCRGGFLSTLPGHCCLGAMALAAGGGAAGPASPEKETKRIEELKQRLSKVEPTACPARHAAIRLIQPA